MGSKTKQRFLTALKIVLFNLVVLVGIDYLFYQRWVAKMMAALPNRSLEQMTIASGLPKALVHSLGSFAVDSPERRIFLSMPLKRGDRVRIGAFGDSFTYGDETEGGLDFPTLLANLFKENGFDNVDVLNFGSSGHGFGQAYRIWDQVARNYELNFVLLGPQCFQTVRDETFNVRARTADRGQSPTLHGRYIVDGDDVTFIDVAEPFELKERFESYYRFFPRWNYLRYDRNPPAFLQSLLPDGKTLPNPFYYSTLSAEDEIHHIHRVLLNRMLQDPAQIVLLHEDPRIARFVRETFPTRMVAESLAAPNGVLFSRPGGHHSAAGNLAVARAFFDVLTARDSIRSQIVEFDNEPPSYDSTGPWEGFDSFARVELRVAGETAAVMLELTDPPVERKPFDFHSRNIKSMLALKSKNLPLVESVFLPLEFEIRSGLPLTLEVTVGRTQRKKLRIPLGAVTLASAEAPIGYVVVSGLSVMTELSTERNERGEMYLGIDGVDLDQKQLRSGRILLGEAPIYDVTADLQLVPIGRTVGYFLPAPSTLVDVERLPASGNVSLAFVGDHVREISFGRFVHQIKESEYSRTGLHQLIRRSASRPTQAEVVRDGN
jgi:hypothetical protein